MVVATESGPIAVAVEERELKLLVEGVRFIEKTMRHPVDKDAAAGEMEPLRNIFTKSVVARVDLPADTVLSQDPFRRVHSVHVFGRSLITDQNHVLAFSAQSLSRIRVEDREAGGSPWRSVQSFRQEFAAIVGLGLCLFVKLGHQKLHYVVGFDALDDALELLGRRRVEGFRGGDDVRRSRGCAQRLLEAGVRLLHLFPCGVPGAGILIRAQAMAEKAAM